ncbi:serine/threonine-protein kinase [Streptomyces sp. H51]|uniref:serine/threonine-protein kinase n=1 Tax=Streptomyces sp. H51 TaxID=3111770 RepID=UPI002D778695|nr:serine/threonine-protein kinase [Streptomyces sp. H51]
MPVNLPERIGPYRPLRHLGTGGMGTVYYATDPDSGRPLAVKVLHQGFADDPGHRARFRRETTMLRKVTGPYLVPLVDADPDAPLPWLATAYVRGNTLHQHVRDSGPLRADNLLTFAAAVAHALACVHAAGVAHRDLKPTNVLLAADGPHVVDFGIAHHLDATAITAASVTTGTPGWMAPEQLTDGTTLPACDIFCWGLLVAYAAAAAHPFGAPTGINHRIISAAPSLQDVPDALLPLVRDALHKDPAQRPTAAETAERAAAVYGPTGTVVFPTVAYTRSFEGAETAVTVPLDHMRWNVPLPAEPSAAEEPAGERPVGEGPAGEEPAGEGPVGDGEPVGEEPTGDEGAAARPAPSQPPVPQVPGRPAPPATAQDVRRGGPPVPPAPGAVPAGRRTRRRRAVVCTVAAAAVLGAVAGAVAAGHGGNGDAARHPAGGPTAEPKRTAASRHPVTAPPSASASPSAEESPTQQQPRPVDLFGGLRVVLPAGSALEFSRSGDGNADSGMPWDTPDTADTADASDTSATTAATGADFVLHGDPDTGVRLMYSPSLTLDQIEQGRTDSGSMWSVESEGSDTVTDESVVSVKDGPPTGIGGKKAMSWTFGTDVLPDYDGSRKSSHRVWWLPYSKYLLYTYGKHDKAAEAAVNGLIEGIAFEATQMPRDCADAVVALDKAAADGEQTDDHGALTNCYDAAVNGAEQLDPGTLRTRTEAACVALVEAYRGYGSYPGYDEAKAYKELRPWCDLPGAVSDPRLPDWAL